MSVIGVRVRVANQIPDMKTKIISVLVASVALLIAAGCASVDSRIAKNRAAFNTWPPAVQDKVVRGQIDIGFTRDQVAVALGGPDRVFTRTTSDGTTETWAYRDRGPRFSFGVGVGMGSFGRHGGSFGSVGIGTSTGGYRDDEKLGVVFDRNGVVSSIETRAR